MATTLIVKDGVIVLPAELRDRYGFADGAEVIAEEGATGILLRPADQSNLPEIEIYTPERKAEFLLNNAVDAADYAGARDEVARMGLDPDQIPHVPPRS